MPFTTILFPADFSDRSRAIVPCVKVICDRFNAAPTLLHLAQATAMTTARSTHP